MAGGQQQQNARVFGQAVRTKSHGRRGGSAATRYQRQMGQRSLPSNLTATNVSADKLSEEDELAARKAEARRRRKVEGGAFDSRFLTNGRFDRTSVSAPSAAKGGKVGGGDGDNMAIIKSETATGVSAKSRRGWIFNMLPTVRQFSSLVVVHML